MSDERDDRVVARIELSGTGDLGQVVGFVFPHSPPSLLVGGDYVWPPDTDAYHVVIEEPRYYTPFEMQMMLAGAKP